MIDVFTGVRPAGDILSRVVRFSLGGTEYVLPVRSIKANREWKATLDERTTGLLSGLEASGNDLSAIFGLLAAQIDDLIDMLLAYDTTDVLPTKDAIESIEPDASLDVLQAVREVWRAANPLVDTTMQSLMETIPEPDSSPPTSTPVRPTGTARPKRSTKH